ncbi:glycosyltransferase family 2 protein [Paenibacillus oryzae]|nr:glycosyltransferase [Paenibacillus oryzae]
METELVSIVMPTYNRGNVIEKAIDSVINQTYSNWELFIVDDASLDNTKEVVSNYINEDSRIQFISNTINKGANACRNQGAAIAHGEYIAFIDSDNQWYPDKLLKQVEVLNTNSSNTDFVYSKEKVINEESIKIIPQKAYSPEELMRILPHKNVVDTSTVMITKTCFNLVGGFDEMMPRLQDWELFFRTVVVYGYKGVCINEVLNTNILQENSISKDDKKYVDAIFYMLKKHNSYFSDADLISQIINSTIGEEEYLLLRVREVYSNDLSVMASILEKVIYTLQNKQRQFELLYRWQLKDKNEFYKEIKNKDIAIYGLGKWGELLYRDLKGLSAHVVFGIDREAEQFHDLPVKTACTDFFDIEVIIISVIDGASEIEKMLRPKCTGEILLLEDLIKTKK